jgi:hypothetical protein
LKPKKLRSIVVSPHRFHCHLLKSGSWIEIQNWQPIVLSMAKAVWCTWNNLKIDQYQYFEVSAIMSNLFFSRSNKKCIPQWDGEMCNFCLRKQAPQIWTDTTLDLWHDVSVPWRKMNDMQTASHGNTPPRCKL